MLALAKDVSELYPELIAAGSLVKALETALRNAGSPYTVIERRINIGVLCARVEGEGKRSQAYIVKQQRLFVFDLWRQNSILVGATTPSLMDAVERIHSWLATTSSAADVVAGLERISVDDDGIVYNARDDIDQAWSCALDSPSFAAFAREASKREKLRQLFPYGTYYLGFSRCTRYPFTFDIPIVHASGADEFTVRDRDRSSDKVYGRGNAVYAADLVEALLPPDCGPAVSGTRESLGPPDREM